MNRWSAVLLAGSRPKGDPLAQSMMVGHKALIEVAGEPMVLRPLTALLQHPRIAEIIVLTQDPDDLRSVLPQDERIVLRASKATIAASLAELVNHMVARFPILVTTADHVLLDGQMISEFTDKADGADLAIGVVERSLLVGRFPESKRTWIGFRAGSYTGANLFALGSRKVLPAVNRWRSVEQDRKKGWRVLSALGPALLLGAVLKLRTIEQSAAAVGRKLGMIIRPVALSNPLAGIDVDKTDDLHLVEAILDGRA